MYYKGTWMEHVLQKTWMEHVLQKYLNGVCTTKVLELRMYYKIIWIE